MYKAAVLVSMTFRPALASLGRDGSPVCGIQASEQPAFSKWACARSPPCGCKLWFLAARFYMSPKTRTSFSRFGNRDMAFKVPCTTFRRLATSEIAAGTPSGSPSSCRWSSP